MGVEIKRTATEYLREGDKVTVAVTHECKVNRDSMWVRYEAQSSVAADESTDDASSRVIGHVSNTVIKAVESAAEAALRGQR